MEQEEKFEINDPQERNLCFKEMQYMGVLREEIANDSKMELDSRTGKANRNERLLENVAGQRSAADKTDCGFDSEVTVGIVVCNGEWNRTMQTLLNLRDGKARRCGLWQDGRNRRRSAVVASTPGVRRSTISSRPAATLKKRT